MIFWRRCRGSIWFFLDLVVNFERFGSYLRSVRKSLGNLFSICMNQGMEGTNGLQRSSRKTRIEGQTKLQSLVTIRREYAKSKEEEATLEHWTTEEPCAMEVPAESNQRPKPPSGICRAPFLVMAWSLPRLKYRKFQGDRKEDVDNWLCDFNSTATAKEEEIATKLHIFQGLLKKEALHWYQDILEPVRNDWKQLTTSFFQTFREVGGKTRTLWRLSKMKMDLDKSVQRYGQRVRYLINKLTPGIAASVQIEWYIVGFLDDKGFQVQQAWLQTLQEAIEAAQHYENSKQSLRQTRGMSKSESSKRGKKILKNKRDASSRSSNSSGTESKFSDDKDSK